MSSSSDRSKSPVRTQRDTPGEKPAQVYSENLFIGNLSPITSIQILNKHIRQILQKKCTVISVDTKKSMDGKNSFAFVKIKEVQRISEIINYFDGTKIDDRKISIQRQKPRRSFLRSKSPRRKDGNLCYNCQGAGHYARECPKKNKGSRQDRSRFEEKRSPQERKRSRKHKRRRSDSSSSSSSSDSSSSSESERRHRKRRRHQKEKRERRERQERSDRKRKQRRHYSSSDSSRR